jgi:hypothetical protein
MFVQPMDSAECVIWEIKSEVVGGQRVDMKPQLDHKPRMPKPLSLAKLKACTRAFLHGC